MLTVILIFLSGCSFFKDSSDDSKGSAVSGVISKTVVVKAPIVKKDPVIENWASQLAQADAIFRESWRLASGVETGIGKSPFARLYRPIVKELSVKLGSATGLVCDRYRIEKSGDAATPLWEIYNDCGATDKDWLGSLKQDGQRMIINFAAEPMKDVLGLQSSFITRKVLCELEVAEKKLTSLKCGKFAKDKSDTEVLRFDSFEYSSAGAQMIYLSGKILVNLAETRKFEFKLPQTGRGLFTETELFPAQEEPASPKVAPVPARAGEVVRPGTAQDADHIRRQIPSIPQGALGGRGARGAPSEPDAEQEVMPDPAQEATHEPTQESQGEEQVNHEEIKYQEGDQGEANFGTQGDSSRSSGGEEAAPIQDPRNGR